MFKSEKQRARATLFQSVAQPGAQGDAGLYFGLFPPSLVRPRPLARALGTMSTPVGVPNTKLGTSKAKRERVLPSGKIIGLDCYIFDCDSYFLSFL